jgi:hypothetical protein
MDLTERYIKMCHEATEIQELKPECGVIVYELFSQSQLQTMVLDKFGGQQVSMLWYFADYLKRDRPIEYSLEVTLEQLWLCFVMKERFNKVWSESELKWKEIN